MLTTELWVRAIYVGSWSFFMLFNGSFACRLFLVILVVSSADTFAQVVQNERGLLENFVDQDNFEEYVDHPLMPRLKKHLLARLDDLKKLLGQNFELSLYDDEIDSQTVRLRESENRVTELAINLSSLDDRPIFSLPYEIFKERDRESISIYQASVQRAPNIALLSILNPHSSQNVRRGDARTNKRDEGRLFSLLKRDHPSLSLIQLHGATELELEESLAKLRNTRATQVVVGLVAWGHGDETNFSLSRSQDFSGEDWANVVSLALFELGSAERVATYLSSCSTGCNNRPGGFQYDFVHRTQQILSLDHYGSELARQIDTLHHEDITSPHVLRFPEVEFVRPEEFPRRYKIVDSLFMDRSIPVEPRRRWGLSIAFLVAGTQVPYRVTVHAAEALDWDATSTLFLSIAAMAASFAGVLKVVSLDSERQVAERDGRVRLVEVNSEKISEPLTVHPVPTLQEHLARVSSERASFSPAASVASRVRRCLSFLGLAGEYLRLHRHP